MRHLVFVFGPLTLAACGMQEPPPLTLEGDEAGECTDGQDNDDDGLADCDDIGCRDDTACIPTTTTTATGTSTTPTGDTAGGPDCNPVPRWLMTVDFGWRDVTEEISSFTLLDTTIPPGLSFNYGPADWNGNLQDTENFCYVSYDISDWRTDIVPEPGHLLAFGGTIEPTTPVSTNCYDYNACLDDFAGYDSPEAVIVGNFFQVHIAVDVDKSLDSVISKDLAPSVFGGVILSDVLPPPGTTPVLGYGFGQGVDPWEVDPAQPLRLSTDSISGGRLSDGVYTVVAPTLFGWSR